MSKEVQRGWKGEVALLSKRERERLGGLSEMRTRVDIKEGQVYCLRVGNGVHLLLRSVTKKGGGSN